MADFPTALNILKLAEGPGGVADPNDPGTLTVWGITRTYEQSWPGWPRFDALKAGTAQPVDNGQPCAWPDDGQLQAAVETHYRQAWDSLLLGEFTNQTVANAVLGAFVNQGPKVIRMLQAAAGVAQDGAMGPETVAAVNAAPCVWEKFSIQRLRYYNETAKDVFLRGLFSRVLVTGA